jgi:uncharacterized protein
VRAALTVLGVLLLVVALLWAFQRRLVFLPGAEAVPPMAGVLAGAHEVTLTTSDGLALGAWHLPAEPGRPTVLVANGNAGHRGHRTPLAQALGVHGLGVLLFDYRGYGGNPGTPTEQGLGRDVRAARDYLTGVAGVAPQALVYFGESLGAAVVADLAREHPPAALVLRSPFTSLADVAAVHYRVLPVRLLLRDRFAVTEAVAEVAVPTVVVLGTADAVVPPAQSRAVAAAAGGRTRVVEVAGAGHNDPPLLHGAEVVEAVLSVAP